VNSPTPGIMPINTPKLPATVAMRLNSQISLSAPKMLPRTGWGLGAVSLSVSSRKAWLSANRPSTTTIRSKPPVSHVCSNVMRWLYFTSSPTVFSNRPKAASIPAANTCPRWASTTRTIPSKAARKISRLPKCGAIKASTGESRIRQMIPKTPPQKDAE